MLSLKEAFDSLWCLLRKGSKVFTCLFRAENRFQMFFFLKEVQQIKGKNFQDIFEIFKWGYENSHIVLMSLAIDSWAEGKTLFLLLLPTTAGSHWQKQRREIHSKYVELKYFKRQLPLISFCVVLTSSHYSGTSHSPYLCKLSGWEQNSLTFPKTL